MQGGKNSWWRYAPIVLIGAGLAIGYALDAHHLVSLDMIYQKRMALKAYVSGNLAVSAAGFCLLYAVAIAFVFPAPVILTVTAGFLFGWWIGGSLAVIGATIGGSALFLAARSAFGDVLKRRAGGAIKRFAEGFRKDAFTYLLVLRLTPVLPVAALNIGPAFFDISLRSFVLATFLGIIPGAMVYAFLGSGLDRALKIAGKTDGLSIHDLMTVEMTVALVGLSALSLLGVALRRWLMRSPAAGPATDTIGPPADQATR